MTARAMITDDWLPLPTEILDALGWGYGTQIELEVVNGVLIATQIDPVPTPRPAPSKRSALRPEKDRPSAT